MSETGARIELDPKNTLAWANRGFAHARRGDQERAIADDSRAIELDPSLAVAFPNRGLALGKRGDRSGARRDLERFLALAPGDQDAPKARAALE